MGWAPWKGGGVPSPLPMHPWGRGSGEGKEERKDGPDSSALMAEGCAGARRAGLGQGTGGRPTSAAGPLMFGMG